MPQTLGEAVGERSFLHSAGPDTSGCSSNWGRLGWGWVPEPPVASMGGQGVLGVQAEVASWHLIPMTGTNVSHMGEHWRGTSGSGKETIDLCSAQVFPCHGDPGGNNLLASGHV